MLLWTTNSHRFHWLPIGTIRLWCEVVTRAQKQVGEVDEVSEIIKIVANILRKPLDKLIRVCYNKGTKKKGEKYYVG